MGFGKITNSSSFRHIKTETFPSGNLKVYNKIAGNHNLSNKKELFVNLDKYCQENNRQVFDYVPVTFHITSLADGKFKDFENYFRANALKTNNIWILKPGENTNRGTGISMCTSLEQIAKEISKTKHTVILQKYIENPFLVYKRKFDIRCYAMITCYNGIIQGYYYNEGYIRTSSKPFSLQNVENKYIHLTNDAIQKYSEDYGKYENGNKMSYGDFIEEVGSKIKDIVTDTIKCAVPKIMKKMHCHTFEVFGYDFLLDENLKPWLLEVNTNPCLEISSSHLARIIPSMLDNAFQLTLDSIFQINFTLKNDMSAITENKFELVYHSLEGTSLL
jgi:tubulin polyglutamylase TTLL1/tubulin monoglycylase TTLL3/8